MLRKMGAVLSASLLMLGGCGSSDDDTPKPWDGRYTALEEYGDWQETAAGAYANCKVSGTADPCTSSVESFDLSGCNRATLEGLHREGIYRAKLRYELYDEWGGFFPWGGSGSIRFGANGAPVGVQGYPVVESQVDARTLVATSSRKGASSEGPTRYTLAGCEAPTPGVLTGCFSICTDGRLMYQGTFRAQRMTWGRAERESSGGLRPVSETRVELGLPVDIYVAKDHAYVVSINRAGVKTGGLTVFDVKDRAHPVFKTSISMPGDTYWNGVWSKGDALYVASADSGVVVFDISNPGAPAFVRNVPGGPALDVHTVLVDGDRLYAMSPSPNAETLIFDVSKPLEPQLLGRHVLGVPGYPHDAFAYGNRLYISHGTGGYQVVDVSDPAQVKRLGGYQFEGMFAHHNAVGTIAGQTIAFEGGERLGAHVRMLKVDDPAHIVKIGEFKLRDVTSIHNLILKDQRLYIAWYQEGVRVLDVSNPTQPRQVAHFNTFRDTDPNSYDGLYEGALGIRVPGDGYVYVVDDVRGLFIFPEP
jgi:hypothetical protein